MSLFQITNPPSLLIMSFKSEITKMNFKVLYIVRKLIYGPMIMYDLIPYCLSMIPFS